MIDLKRLIAPLHSDGHAPVAGFGLGALVLWGIDWDGLAFAALLGAVYSARLYSNFPRTAPDDDSVMLAPADGTIAFVDEALPPAELNLGDQPVWRVAIALGAFDSHVIRMPVAATVSRIEYRPGRAGDALAPSAILENERNLIALSVPGGGPAALVQLAGRMIRRISWSVVEGMAVEPGTPFGTIAVDGRVDLYLPAGTRPLVRAGQIAVGGETVLARLA